MYKKLSQPDKQMVRSKKIAGSYSPVALFEHLAEVHSYAMKLNQVQKNTGKHKKNKPEVVMPLSIIGGVALLVIYLIFDGLRYFINIAGIVALVAGLSWWVWKQWQKWQLKRLFIATDILDFLMPLLVILQDEIRPGSNIDVNLWLDRSNQRKYKKQVLKNYILMPHRVIVRYLPLFLLIYGAGRLLGQGVIPELISDVVIIVMIIVYILFFPLIALIAGALFGESPKVKTTIINAPRLVLKATLADGSLFQLDINQVIARKTAVKKKIKVKHWQTAKKKKKYKTKTITSLKLVFPHKKYAMAEATFAKKFNKRPHVSGIRVAKVKLKRGEKRKAVIYQDVQTGQGEGHQPKKLPKPNLHRFLKLVMEGGYNKLKKESPNAKKRIITPKTSADNLTKIKGIGKTTQTKLNEVGIFTFRQIYEITETDFSNLLQEIKVNKKNVESWQTQARDLL